MKRALLAAMLIAFPAMGEVVTSTSRGVLVAHKDSIELIDQGRTLWSAGSVAAPSKIITSGDRAVVLDALHNRLRLIDLGTGKGSSFGTGDTPLDGLFLAGDLYVLSRDARSLERFGSSGHSTLALDADPAFLGQAGGSLYVYSRVAGSLTQILPGSGMTLGRKIVMNPFAASMEIDERTAYLVYPGEAKIQLVTLPQLERGGAITIGSVPVALARASGGSVMAARTLAVADPAARKVWLVEGRQSTAEAFARGFVRGLLGLGLFQQKTSQFPTGVDRIWIAGSEWIAYDSASRTLYRFSKSRSRVLATNVGPSAFAITHGGVAFWRDGVLSVR